MDSTSAKDSEDAENKLTLVHLDRFLFLNSDNFLFKVTEEFKDKLQKKQSDAGS